MWVHWYLALAHHDSVSHKNHLQCLLPTTVTPDHLLIQIVYQSQVEEKIHWAASIITSLFFTPSYIVILIQHCYYNNHCWQHALRREDIDVVNEIKFQHCELWLLGLITDHYWSGDICMCSEQWSRCMQCWGLSTMIQCYQLVASIMYHCWLCWLVTRILLL